MQDHLTLAWFCKLCHTCTCELEVNPYNIVFTVIDNGLCACIMDIFVGPLIELS